MLAEFDLTMLLSSILGPLGVTVLALVIGYVLWGKLGEREKTIQALNEERIKGIALDLAYRQEVISSLLTAVRDSREALTKLNDMFSAMVKQLEDSDGDLEKINGYVQEIQRNLATLLGRSDHRRP